MAAARLLHSLGVRRDFLQGRRCFVKSRVPCGAAVGSDPEESPKAVRNSVGVSCLGRLFVGAVVLLSTSLHAQEQSIRWSDLSGFLVSGASLTKAAADGWTARGSSVEVFGDGDGYVEFGIVETNTVKVAGFARRSIGGSPEEIDFGIRTLATGSFEIVEGGVVKFTGGVLAPSDRFRIALVGSSVQYRQNGDLVYASATAVTPDSRFQFAVSAFTEGAVIDGPVAGGGIAEGVVWTGHVNASSSGNTLWKTTGTTAYDAEGLSTKAINSPDGYLEVSAALAPTVAFVGLSNGNTNTTHQDIDYAFLYAGGPLQIYEGGTLRGSYGQLAATDKLRVSVEGGAVKYRKNGVLLYTSTLAPIYPLLVDTSLHSAGGSIQGAVLSGTLVNVGVSRPVFSVGSGLYSTSQTVTVAGESGSTIHYTTNGSEPTESDPVISSGSSVLIEADTTLKAKAWAAGLMPSGTTTALYRFGTAVTEDVVWTGHVNASSSENTLWKTTGTTAYDAEGLSTKAINSPDGYLEVSASLFPTVAFVGLSSGETNTTYQDIDYAFNLGGGVLQIYEGGTVRGTYGTLVATDKLRVSVEGGEVKYRKNGVLLYTSTLAPIYPLLVDTSLYSATASVQGAALSGLLVESRTPAPTFSLPAGTYDTALNVTLHSAAGVVIRYTLDGVDPTAFSPVYATPIPIALNSPTTIKAIATRPGYLQSLVSSASYTFATATPTVNPNGGSFPNAVLVNLATTTTEATIRYTLDGSEPTEASDPYTGPIGVGLSALVKARAYHASLAPSGTASASFTILPSEPVISPATGTYFSSVDVAISAAPGMTIRYTTDGQEPTTGAPVYTAPFTLSASATVKAKAFAGAVGSGTTVVAYTIRVADPVLSPSSGKWYTQRNVQVTTATPGAAIYYTTDGSEPTTSSSPVPPGGSVLIDRAMVLRVKAFKTGLQPSTAKHGSYLITGQLAGGLSHSISLKANGEVWAWGGNYSGQVGDGGALTVRTSPVFVLSGVIEIAAGTGHSVALKADGTVWTWGETTAGKLGRATAAPIPGQVDLGGVSAIAIAAGTSHTLAVLSNGEVRSWGANASGQLGRGSGNFVSSSTPVTVVTSTGSLDDVVAVAAGASHSLALRSDGTVLAWGGNASGALGDGTTTTRTVATEIPAISGATSISTQTSSSFAVIGPTNELKAWGLNTSNQLGDGTATNRLLPVLVSTGVTRVAAGGTHAVVAGGDARAWGFGRNLERQLGDATAVSRSLPVRSRMSRQVLELGEGVNHSLLADATGAVWATGLAANGQLGLGNTTSPFLPTAIPSFSLVDASNLALDIDKDGLTLFDEFLAGTDPLNPDTNGNGMLDGAERALGLGGTALDSDGDGLSNDSEILVGTDPFDADSDGDGFADGVDQFPLDPSKNVLTPTPGDTAPPTITLLRPIGAVIIP